VTVRYITPEIISVGVIDWDRRLFDKLIPLPQGTSYNSFLIRGSEKTALIDTVYAPKAQDLISNLKKLNVKQLDYIIANHAEPDHSGSITKLLGIYPEAKIVTNTKCKEILISFYHISEDKFIIVGDNEKLSLGNKTLQFILAPWVHWPDTMFTHLLEDKILFTCDFTGSHIASSTLFVESEAEVLHSAKRYYAEIMMPFSAHVNKHLDKIATLDVKIIAPSHGLLYKNPDFILKAHRDWASEQSKNEVIIPFVSMFENTEKMVRHLTDKLVAMGVKVTPYNLPETDLGELAIGLVDASTVVMGTSMVLSGPHPDAVAAAYLINALRPPKLKYISTVGSYGWAAGLGEKMGEQIKSFMPNIKAEMLTPVFVKGLPDSEIYKRLDSLAHDIYGRHKNLV